MPTRRNGVWLYPTWTDWTRALLALTPGQRKTPGTDSRLLRKRNTGGLTKTLASEKKTRKDTRQSRELFRYALASGAFR